MAKKPDAAARRAAERKALNARLAAIRAEEELEALDGEEEPAPGEGEEVIEAEPADAGEEEVAAADGEEDPAAADGAEDPAPADGGDTPPDEEDQSAQAKAKRRTLMIAGLPEARGQEAFATSLANAGLSVADAQASLRAAMRTNAINARQDHSLSARPAGGAKSKSASLVGDYVAATGSTRLRKKA